MAKTIYSKRQKFLCGQLVKAREEAGLTQLQVAAKGVVSQSEISKIENGQRRVEFLILLDLAKLYGKEIPFFTPSENS